MDNLYDFRQDIKYRLAFEKKLHDKSKVVQFFFTLKKISELRSRYEAPSEPEKRGYGMFSSMVIRKAVTSLKEKYATFDDYLNMIVFKSVMPTDYNLIGQPNNDMSLSEIKDCLSHWSETETLYEVIRKRIHENKDIDLHLRDNEPSVLTIHKLIAPEEYQFLKQKGEDKIKLPFLSLLPLSKAWHFYKGGSII